MGYLELDLTISDEAKAMLETARKFGMEVMRPIGIKLDKMADPAEVIAKGSPFWDFIRTQRELGMHKLGIPKEFGGMAGDLDPKVGPLISQEMGYADAGLAISLGVPKGRLSAAGPSPNPIMGRIGF
jgi:alkylation response protein AidB-like acyl-CoA dehydrogenase